MARKHAFDDALNFSNFSSIEKARWYDEKELVLLCLYDPDCFNNSGGNLIKRVEQRTYVLGASVVYMLKKKYGLFYNESDYIDVMSLAIALESPKVFEYVSKNPFLKTEKLVGNNAVDFIHISHLDFFRNIGHLEEKIEQDNPDTPISHTGKIIPNKDYTVTEIMNIASLSYEEINDAIRCGDIKHKIFKRYNGKSMDLPEHGVVFVSGKELMRYITKGKKKSVIPNMKKIAPKIIKNDNADDLMLTERMLANPVLKPDEELRLLKRAAKGDIIARDNIIEANYKLVMSIARKFISTSHHLSLEDLFQEGCIGLIKAVTKYHADIKNPATAKSYKFSTHASWWIMNNIALAIINKGYRIRKPVHIYGWCGKIMKLTGYYIANHGRKPTVKEICKNTGISKEDAIKILEFGSGSAISLNSPVGEDEDSELADFIPSNENIERTTHNNFRYQQFLSELVSKLRGVLNAREYQIFCMRKGLYGEAMTLDEAGKRLGGLTRERTRQIEEKIDEKLSENESVQNLLKKFYG